MFYKVSFVQGKSIVKGKYYGSVVKVGNALHIDVKVDYTFIDVFTDPVDYRERTTGTSNPARMKPDAWVDGKLNGTYYTITDSWTTRITAVINVDEKKSGCR